MFAQVVYSQQEAKGNVNGVICKVLVETGYRSLAKIYTKKIVTLFVEAPAQR